MDVGGQSRQSEEYDDPHMTVGLQDGSSSSMPSNMLSMGEFGGHEKTAWSEDHGSSSMLSTMLKHGGGHATLQASRDGNNSSTLFLSLSFYIFVHMHMLSTTLDATFVYLSIE